MKTEDKEQFFTKATVDWGITNDHVKERIWNYFDQQTTELQATVVEKEAEIEKLNNQLLGLQAKDQWISVSERLPELEGRYLTFDQDGDLEIVKFPDSENLFDTAAYITHWQPLPSPPKK